MRCDFKSTLIPRKLAGLAFYVVGAILPIAAHGESIAASCSEAAEMFNERFIMVKSLQSNGDLPMDSGILVHTIHGPGIPPGASGYLDFVGLRQLTQEMKTACTNPQSADCLSYRTETCGEYLVSKKFLPWCGSNHVPHSGNTLSDSSSWTFVRADTVIQGAKPGKEDEVVCDAGNYDKRYGLIFSNGYMNETANGKDNFGCMYPLDGDTGFREAQGCGISVRPFANKGQAWAQCPLSETSEAYGNYFKTLIKDRKSLAGSLTCSLEKSQFNTWVDVRKRVDLSETEWPVNEFVLWNWNSYTTDDIAQNGYLIGIYYLAGCARSPGDDGKASVARQIASLYKDWTGVTLPVVQLSNAAIRNRTDKPFSCR